MSFNNLQEDLERRVRGFIQDYYDWACFARDNFDFVAQTGPFEIAVRYMMMVDNYCVPEERRHGGISLESSVHHLPEEENITGFTHNGELATVFTKVQWTSGHRSGTDENYEYEFKQFDGHWFLDQIYLHAPRGRFECI